MTAAEVKRRSARMARADGSGLLAPAQGRAFDESRSGLPNDGGNRTVADETDRADDCGLNCVFKSWELRTPSSALVRYRPIAS